MTAPTTDRDNSSRDADATTPDATPTDDDGAPVGRRERRRRAKQLRNERRGHVQAWRRQGPSASLFGHDPAADEPDDDTDAGVGPGEDDYLTDRGQWEDLKGPTPRGLRRSRWLDWLGWYEVQDRDATLTSTRQVVPTNPALIRSQPPFSGSPVGIDEQTGMYVGSDQFVLYDLDIVESINVVIVGDVGVAKSSFVKNH
ncbi:MAG: hypothetical protein L0H41_09275 [Microlunatus sp.]|nr:hypothetical protein [Microlunatus sp.]